MLNEKMTCRADFMQERQIRFKIWKVLSYRLCIELRFFLSNGGFYDLKKKKKAIN